MKYTPLPPSVNVDPSCREMALVPPSPYLGIDAFPRSPLPPETPKD